MRDPSQGLSALTISLPWDPADLRILGGPSLAWRAGQRHLELEEQWRGPWSRRVRSLESRDWRGEWAGGGVMGDGLRRGQEGQPFGRRGEPGRAHWGLQAPKGWESLQGQAWATGQSRVQGGGQPHAAGRCRSGELGAAWRG